MQSLCTRYESTAAMHLPHQNLSKKIHPRGGPGWSPRALQTLRTYLHRCM